jgi:hypothetical protein
MPAGGTPWEEKDFVHPPLECFKPFVRIDEYPVVAWCFHGRGARHMPYDERYAKNAKLCGFNILIDAPSMAGHCKTVGGMKVMVPLFRHSPDRLKKFFEARTDHSHLMGIVLDDNCPVIYPDVKVSAKWLVKNYPHVMPWISENPRPHDQAKTVVRVMGTQNYPFLRGARGQRAETGYCHRLEYDRILSNRYRMSCWQIFGGNVSFGAIRFQMMAALAYGAQGVVNFAYLPHRPVYGTYYPYKPGNPLIAKFHKAHTYIRRVAGRHLWGTRCLGVLHSATGGKHPRATTYGKGELVTDASPWSLVGLLTPENRFYQKERGLPEYLMVVDKRTGGGTPAERELFVRLAASVPVVEVLDYDAIDREPGAPRKVVPGWKITFRTGGGDAALLRHNVDELKKLLGGEQGLSLYTETNAALLERNLTVARAKAAQLGTVLDAAVKAEIVSRAQADDVVKRLETSVAAAEQEAKAAGDEAKE